MTDSLDKRLERLERQHEPEESRVVFRMCHLAGQAGGCEAPPALSREAHHAWHESRGDWVFTLDLGAAGIKGADRWMETTDDGRGVN